MTDAATAVRVLRLEQALAAHDQALAGLEAQVERLLAEQRAQRARLDAVLELADRRLAAFERRVAAARAGNGKA